MHVMNSLTDRGLPSYQHHVGQVSMPNQTCEWSGNRLNSSILWGHCDPVGEKTPKWLPKQVPDSIVVRTSASHAENPGSKAFFFHGIKK